MSSGAVRWSVGNAAIAFALVVIAPVMGRAEVRDRRPSVAFFYGNPLPVPELKAFDWLVVEPENVDARQLSELQRAGVEVFGYLSLGEARADAVDASWIIGRNPAWDSAIMDPAAAGWRARVLGRADALWARGYRGLFLDTLDSYVAAVPDSPRRRAAAAALASLVRELRAGHPGFKLFFNRGFELLDEVGSLASGLAAESLFSGWSAAEKRYGDVSDDDRVWLLERLRAVRARYGIPVVAIDYVAPGRRDAAREIARRIEALGVVPWVASAALDTLGVGAIEVVPRRVLLVYDGAEAPGLVQARVHRLAALPLEHAGLVPDYVDVRAGLPPESLAGRYAGIVTWFLDDELPDAPAYAGWLLRQLDAGVRVAVLGRLGFPASAPVLARLGLAPARGEAARSARFVRRDALIGFEAEPALRSRGLSRWRAASPELAVHLSVEDAAGEELVAVATAPWGGVALDPFLVEVGFGGAVRWIVDPFVFLERALAIAPQPALDVTTEDGAWLLLVTADGTRLSPSGALSGEKPAAQVILERVLQRVPVPTTVVLPRRDPVRRSGAAAARVDRACMAIGALRHIELADDLPGLVGTEDAGPSLASLAPLGLPTGGGFRVYVPGVGESAASDLAARGILDRAHLAALARRLDAPRRLKPLGIHYSFLAAARPSAVRALDETLRWAVAQRLRPVWASEYAGRVAEFRSAVVVRRLDGSWAFRGLEKLRTVRVPRALGRPDRARSSAVASVTEHGEDLYVSFGQVEHPVLTLASGSRDG